MRARKTVRGQDWEETSRDQAQGHHAGVGGGCARTSPHPAHRDAAGPERPARPRHHPEPRVCAQPLMLLYHCNYGFPLLAPGARVVGPISRSVARDEEARKTGGWRSAWGSRIRSWATRRRSSSTHSRRTAMGKPSSRWSTAILRRPAPGVVMRWSLRDLPTLCQWKMIAKGFYVVGLEPGTMLPIGRGPLR